MQSFAIIVFCVLAACVYGIIHDQVTARICLEYFTIAHPPIFKQPVSSPTAIAFVWGIIATWWVGLGLGIPLAIAARSGERPKKTVRDLAKPILILLATMALLAVAAGAVGAVLAKSGWIKLPIPLAGRVPPDRHVGLIADAFAHNMSYLAGAIGGVIVIVHTWRSRRQRPLG
jgi:hypothetical protein